jgi:hypothetical protein
MSGGDEVTEELWKEFGEKLARAVADTTTSVLSSFRPAFERAGLGEQFRAYEEEMRLTQTEFGSRARARAQEAADAGADFAKAFRGLTRAGTEALRLFWEKGKSVPLDPSKPDETLRALHEAWLSAYNESMRAYTLSDDFGRALARFLDARTESEKKIQQEGEKVLKSMGAPTRSEVDALHKRLLEVQRRLDHVDPPVKRKKKEVKRGKRR